MSDGLGGFVALLLAFGICVVRPGFAALAILLLVVVCVAIEGMSRPTADGNRREEREESDS